MNGIIFFPVISFLDPFSTTSEDPHLEDITEDNKFSEDSNLKIVIEDCSVVTNTSEDLEIVNMSEEQGKTFHPVHINEESDESSFELQGRNAFYQKKYDREWSSTRDKHHHLK